MPSVIIVCGMSLSSVGSGNVDKSSADKYNADVVVVNISSPVMVTFLAIPCNSDSSEGVKLLVAPPLPSIAKFEASLAVATIPAEPIYPVFGAVPVAAYPTRYSQDPAISVGFYCQNWRPTVLIRGLARADLADPADLVDLVDLAPLLRSLRTLFTVGSRRSLFTLLTLLTVCSPRSL